MTTPDAQLVAAARKTIAAYDAWLRSGWPLDVEQLRDAIRELQAALPTETDADT